MVRHHIIIARRVAFVGFVISAILCTIGFFVPKWQSGNTEIGIVRQNLHGGIWWYCVDEGNGACYLYPLGTFGSRDGGKDWAIRLNAIVNVFLMIVCAAVSMCLEFCAVAKTARTAALLFLASISCGTGAAASIIYGTYGSDGYYFKLDDPEFEWAFIIYVVGVGIGTLVLPLLLFEYMDNPISRGAAGQSSRNNTAILDKWTTSPGRDHSSSPDHSQKSTPEHSRKRMSQHSQTGIFVQTETFLGSQLPASEQDQLPVAEEHQLPPPSEPYLPDTEESQLPSFDHFQAPEVSENIDTEDHEIPQGREYYNGLDPEVNVETEPTKS